MTRASYRRSPRYHLFCTAVPWLAVCGKLSLLAEKQYGGLPSAMRDPVEESTRGSGLAACRSPVVFRESGAALPGLLEVSASPSCFAKVSRSDRTH